MMPEDSAQDRELLERYRRASGSDPAAPSDAVREAILAESRRIAERLAKRPQTEIDTARPAANESRWKLTAFGAVGAALLVALLFTPRYFESVPPASTTAAPAPAAQLSNARSAAPPSPLARPEPDLAAADRNEPAEEIVTRKPARKTAPSADAASALDERPAGDARAGLQSAAESGDVLRATVLLDRGAFVDERDTLGRTALMVAVTQNRPEIVRLLLARGADPNAADNAGHTPLHLAGAKNLHEIAGMLEQAGAR